MLGFLGSLLSGPLVKAGSWLLGKVGSAVKSIGSSIFGNDTVQKVTSAVGPAIANRADQGNFLQNMKQFGTTVENRLSNMGLKPVIGGQNVGDAFYKGMTSIYNFMRNGGQDTQMKDDSGQPMQNVERQNNSQQQQQYGGDQQMNNQ